MAQRSGRIQLAFTNGFYQTRSKPFSSQRCVNWYPNKPTAPALNPENLYATPGLKQVLSGLDGVGRGSHYFNGILFCVCGETLYEIQRSVDADGNDVFSAENRGEVVGDDDVIMDSTRLQMCILVPGGRCYIYTQSTEILTDITDNANFLKPAIDVVAIDSYFMFAQQGERIIFHSNINNGLVYGALDYYQIQQFPEVKGLVVYRNQLYAMGESVTVPFYNTGGLEFSFAPVPNAVIDSGLSGQYAKSPFRGSFVYLGSGQNAERSVWLFNGGQPQKISTEPIDYIIQDEPLESVRRSKILRHSQNGAEFIVFQIGDYTFVYDLSSGLWHERRSRIPYRSNYIDSPWRVKSITQAYNKVFVTDSNEGILGEIDDLTRNDYGVKIHRYVITQPFINFGVRGKVWAIEAYVDTGFTSQDTFQIRWSDDGYKWSDTISRSMGAVGDYGRRIVFDRLGSFPNSRTLRFDYTGESPCSFNALMANVS